MKVHKNFRAVCALILAAGLLLAAAGTHAQEHDHSAMHGQSVPDMDEQGRRLDKNAASHELDDAALAALREKIALYRALTDREAKLNMALMGPNYEWYVSDTSLRGDIGVLVLAHGVGKNSDRMFADALQPVALRWPTAVSFGMAMMMSSHIQSAVDDLTERGAGTIILVPTAVTEYNTLTRQWEYVFGMRDESSYLDVPRVKTSARVVMTRHYGDHLLITEILADHAQEASKNPKNEVVIIVAHGPEDVEDNVLDLEITQVHADRIKAQSDYVDVKIINLQDDAYPPIRASNVKKLRRWITSAQRAGNDVVVVVCAAASHGVQTHIRQDLRGLDYAFAGKGFNEHPNYVKWIEAAIDEQIAAQ